MPVRWLFVTLILALQLLFPAHGEEPYQDTRIIPVTQDLSYQRQLLVQYHAALQQTIQQHWQIKQRLDTLECTVLFTINRQGQVTQVKLIKSSGDPRYDEECIKTILSVTRFSPLPPDFSLAHEINVEYAFQNQGVI